MVKRDSTDVPDRKFTLLASDWQKAANAGLDPFPITQ